MPAKYIIATDTKVLSGIVTAATTAERNGNSTIITKIITAIEIRRSRKNELTLIATTLGLSAMRVMVTSPGKSLI